ncbi:MAG: cadmium-translocating P-type ATPase, partial [Elusimicrobia bacterium]|nr:cadmium-translocating P-type ATPase [Elusimicrobiota bacterium]
MQSFQAVLALSGILLHLALRAGGAQRTIADAPLWLVLAAAGAPALWGIARRLLGGDFGADLLAAISIVAAAVLGQPLAGAILVLMLSGGAALERYASRNASRVLEALARRMPQVAHRRLGLGVEDVGVERIAVGDVLRVLPHELCPVDGVVLEGRGAMDESYLTGEPFELAKTPGSCVLSGAVNGSSALTIRAVRPAAQSRYARIMAVMEDVERRRPRLRRLGDRLAAWYVPLSLGLAAAAWVWTGQPLRFLSVLVVATPCPLLIAIPVAVVGTISLAASRGIIVKSPAALELIAECRTLIVDKTGTLTVGKPSLTDILPVGGTKPEEALSLAASLERYSRHPLAAALIAAADAAGLEPLEAVRVCERPGEGLSGEIAGRRLLLSGRGTAEGLPGPGSGLECLLSIDGAPAAIFRFHDVPRPESRPFLDHLPGGHGIEKIILLSGDRESEVKVLAGRLGIEEAFGGQSPEQKVAVVRREAARSKTLFVGDGVNDAPALAAATVGVAIGPNSDVTAEAAGAVVMNPSLGKLDELIHIGRRMRAIALQSAVGGMALSLVGMAFAAAGGLTPVQGAVFQEI